MRIALNNLKVNEKAVQNITIAMKKVQMQRWINQTMDQDPWTAEQKPRTAEYRN
jgi:hypothetical protein